MNRATTAENRQFPEPDNNITSSLISFFAREFTDIANLKKSNKDEKNPVPVTAQLLD